MVIWCDKGKVQRFHVVLNKHEVIKATCLIIISKDVNFLLLAADLKGLFSCF